jgi:hypothetical protein
VARFVIIDQEFSAPKDGRLGCRRERVALRQRKDGGSESEHSGTLDLAPLKSVV